MQINKTLTGPEQAPSSGRNPKQLVVLLHGLGSDGQDLIGLAPEFSAALPDAQFVSPNAPFPCDMAPFGYQWFSLMDRSDSKVLAGARDAEPILNHYIDSQLERFGLEDKDLILAGFSQGSMMAMHVGLRRTKSCAGVLGYSGALVGAELLEKEITSKPSVCLAHGTFDEVVPFAMMDKAEKALSEADVNVQTHACIGIGHGIAPKGLDVGKKFLKAVTMKEGQLAQ